MKILRAGYQLFLNNLVEISLKIIVLKPLVVARSSSALHRFCVPYRQSRFPATALLKRFSWGLHLMMLELVFELSTVALRGGYVFCWRGKPCSTWQHKTKQNNHECKFKKKIPYVPFISCVCVSLRQVRMYGGCLSDFFKNPCNPSSHTAYIMLCNILALLCMKMRNRRTICSKRRSSISILTLLYIGVWFYFKL